MGENLAPSTQGSTRTTIRTRARCRFLVDSANAKLKDSAHAFTVLFEQVGVNGCVIVPTIAFVAPVSGHDAAHRSGGKEIDSAKAFKQIGRLAKKNWSPSDDDGSNTAR